VLHHYVSAIPFYNADEATEAIKPVMGKHYRADTRDGSVGFLRSLWTSTRWCMWVEPSEGVSKEMQGVLFFRNTNGFGPRPLRLEKPVAI
jgi:omega-6 fatty acid desaturase / acyl-lipid omega-6 desaturase (Delta-12 desaturase)